LESAVLANEAYLKLVRAGRIRCENRVHFLALCSQIVRRLLVDHARKRGYVKRGGGTVQVSLDEGLLAGRTRQADVLALHDALASLSELDPRKARLVELRYFGGLRVAEAAEVLAISPETAKRDWKIAKAWLFGELTKPDAVPTTDNAASPGQVTKNSVFGTLHRTSRAFIESTTCGHVPGFSERAVCWTELVR
jgi:RNA polymerase sigma-70 factor (ECF subfamily)